MSNKQANKTHLNILLVEDNIAHAELVIRGLESSSFRHSVYHVDNGEKALNILFKQQSNTRERSTQTETIPSPDLVLLDLKLPKLSGLDVLKQIKLSDELRSLPVVILTTSGEERDVLSAYKHFANSYLIKPSDFSKFSTMMEDLSRYWLEWNHGPHPFPFSGNGTSKGLNP